MNIILLSGGSGKRLWPLSNEHRSKQFLRLIKNDEEQYESMVQRVYRQIMETDRNSNIVITTGKTQISSIRNQLGKEVEVCVEPQRRDTFPAIALANAFFALKKGYNMDDVVIICPVDPFTEIEYFKTLKILERIIKEDKAKIALMGVKPTYPSEKYGYIVPRDKEGEYRGVKEFVEKPNLEKASQLVGEGGLWNCGVFAFKIRYMMNIIDKYIKYESYEDVYNNYEKFPKISFDYEVLEKENDAVVVEFEGMWKDLGTWNTLTEEMEESTVGNVIIGSSCENINAINELPIPILIMGAKNMIVSASSDGIIVSDKHESSYIKPFVDAIDRRVMFEEKSWGTFNIINMEIGENNIQSLTVKIEMKQDKCFSYHSHQHRDEIWIILSGKGEIIINEEQRGVTAGEVIRVNAGDRHKLKAITELSLVEIQIGESISDEDTINHKEY